MFFTDFCSHHLSWVFYAESLLNETAFMGVKYSEMGQPCSEQVVMGYSTPPTAYVIINKYFLYSNFLFFCTSIIHQFIELFYIELGIIF